jgi:imidazolonepropionase-like amidohydrolase
MLARSLRAIALLVLRPTAIAKAQTTTAITGARVIDGTGSPPRVETVIVRGNRIIAVSDHADIPAGARIIGATGQTLVPRLFDLQSLEAAIQSPQPTPLPVHSIPA